MRKRRAGAQCCDKNTKTLLDLEPAEWTAAGGFLQHFDHFFTRYTHARHTTDSSVRRVLTKILSKFGRSQANVDVKDNAAAICRL